MSDLFRIDHDIFNNWFDVGEGDGLMQNFYESGFMVPVDIDYETGVKKAGETMQELDNFEAAIVAGIRAALGVTDADS